MISEYEIKKQICDIGKRMYNDKMAAANAGNISVRLNENQFLCTPAGISKGIITPEYICKIDRNGKVIQGKDGYRPCPEIQMHLKVYEERPDVNAVIHAHPVYATSYAVAGIPLTQPIMPETVAILGSVPVIKCDVTSSEEISKGISGHIKDYDAVLLENHGVLTCSKTLQKAYLKMESVEFYAQVLYQSQMLGGPKELITQQVEKASHDEQDVELVTKIAQKVMEQLGFPNKSHRKV